MWLTFEETAALGTTPQWIRKQVASGEWESRGTGRRGRNGKEIKEVLLESLPQKLQLQWARENAPGDTIVDAETEPVKTDSEVKLIAALQRYAPEVREAFLAEAQRLLEIARRYERVETKRAKNAEGKYEFVPEVLAICSEAVCTEPLVLSVEGKRSKSPSPITLDGWLRKSKTEGLLAFIRSSAKPPSGTNDRRKAKVSAAAVEFLNTKFKNYPSPRHLHRALRKQAQKHGWIIPSESWVRRKYDHIPAVARTLIYDGQKAYNSRLAPFVPRDYRDLEALQILCGDHSVRDVTVMLPDGNLTRPWLTVWQDLRTGLIWGWHLDLTPSSNTIGLAYVNGVQNFGAQPLSRPDDNFYSYLQTDQGRDYRSKTLTGQTLTFKDAARIEGGLNALCTQRKVGFLDEMGLKQMLARGYNAKEKSVERTFRVISDFEENHFEAEYCGRDAKNKPEKWQRAWNRHQKLLKKFKGNLEFLRDESPFISFDDYRENLAGFITEYNNTEHKRAVLGGATIIPTREYERLYTTRYEISDDALALLLMKAAKRKLGKNGVQMFQSHWYFWNDAFSEFKGDKKLEIEIRYTDGDYSRLWAVLPDGRIVEAPLITPTSIQPGRLNKKTMETVAKAKASERKLVRDFQFVQQSNFRGESTEDRVAAQLVDPDETPQAERQKIAVNARPSVVNMTRFDRPKLASTPKSSVSIEQIERAEVVDIFREKKPAKRIKQEWED